MLYYSMNDVRSCFIGRHVIDLVLPKKKFCPKGPTKQAPEM